MSLNSFHKFLITIAILFFGGMAIQLIREFSAKRQLISSIYIALTTGISLGLIFYLRWFIKKGRN